MNPDRELVRRYFTALCAEASTAGSSLDVVGRLLIDEVITLWRRSRPASDIADELEFLSANLDPDQDYVFMRP